MRAISPARRHRPKTAARFSLKPVAVLLCAVLAVRALYTTDAVDRLYAAVSSWSPGRTFSALAMQGAGIPNLQDKRQGWIGLIQMQSLVFSPLSGDLVASAPVDIPPEDPAQTPEPAPSAAPDVEPPRTALFFARSFWLPPGGEALPDASFEHGAEIASDPSGPAAGDGRAIPTPAPGDPNAKRVLEVTLTAPEGAPPGVYIGNKTKYLVSVQDVLAKKTALKATDAKEPQVLIIHTHGSESFLPDERDYYVPTDIERTEDTRYNVVRLGDEMEIKLKELGLNVIHDRGIYDSPSYSGAYGRSLAAIQKYMKQHPSIQVVIDIHRDSISASDGSIYKAVSTTDRGKAAQMMIVVGSDGSGLTHPNWKQNLAFACDLDKTILDTYPTLMRPVNLRKERFNQHATVGSIILEVGTAGNTLSEALLSVDLFCETAGTRLAGQLLKR